MNVNRRTWTLLIVAVAIISGVYSITLWQRARETQRLMEDLQSPDHATAAQAMTSLRERVSAIDDRLIGMARQEGADVRWRAVELLAQADDDASRDVLMDALQAADPVVRAAAARALAERGVRGSADRIALLATAEEESMQVRLAAVRALQRLRTSTHLAEMSQLATDRPPPPPEDEPEEDEPAEDLEEVEEWSDDTVDLRIEAVRAIAVLGARDGQSALDAASILVEASSPAEHDSNVRKAACYALTDLAQLEMSDAVRAEVVQALLAAATDEIGSVRVAAVHGLTLVRPTAELRAEVRQTMEDALNDEHYWVRVAAGEEPIGG